MSPRVHAARLVVLAALLLIAAPLKAVTKWKGLEPGTTTRTDAERVLGTPTRSLSATLFEYRPQQDTGPITVEYRSDGAIEKIEVQLARPVGRTPLINAFKLAGLPGAKRPATDGKLVEFFAANAAVVFFYNGNEDAAGILRIGFYSKELFDRLTGALQTVPTNSVSEGKTEKKLLNPNDCHDIFNWAQNELDTAKRSRNAARRQAVLDIQITSQKGECDKARQKQTAYQQAYKP